GRAAPASRASGWPGMPAAARADVQKRRLLFLVGVVPLLAGCAIVSAAPQPTPRPPGEPPLPALTPAANVPGDPQEGRRLFLASGCGGCHTLDGLPGATGVAGPNLTNVALP